ncbi:unnamed protein product [Cylindrotheca closterium]|uniref:Uncharacterized protein n=1 Tax=Cylindrotheca closterium TaxID=2856 RepID=A0AAD2CVJ1_9STRA|nr:unnamed protein product [Cylindrotheca closterium]
MKLLQFGAKKQESKPSMERSKSPLRPFSVFRSPKRSPKEVESQSSVEIARIPMNFSPLVMGTLIPPHSSPLTSQKLSPGSLIPPVSLIPPPAKRTTHSSPLQEQKLSPGSLIPPETKRTTHSSPFSTEKFSPKAKAMMLPARAVIDQEKVENNENLDFLKRLERSDRSRPADLMIATPNYFAPPKEIKINRNAEPPSPMRDPDMSAPRPSERKPLSNLLNSPGRVVPPEIGEPLGDIGMKTQLWDAQRLVRVILGSATGDDPLDSGSILKAIRTFALMKAELTQLRQQQEHLDPPAIMPLMTPSTCATNLFAESTPQNQAQHMKDTSPWRKTPPSNDVHRRGLIEAAKKIQSLEEELEYMKNMMAKMQDVTSDKEALLNRAKEDNEELCQQIRTTKERLSQQREQANKSKEQKDFRMFKLEKSNRRMYDDIVQVVEDLEQSNLETSKNQTLSIMQKELARYKEQRLSIIATLKASIQSSSDLQMKCNIQEGSEKLKQLKDEHEGIVSTIRLIEDFNFGLL